MRAVPCLALLLLALAVAGCGGSSAYDDVIDLVDKKGEGWLIDDLDASTCEVGGACVPFTDREVA